MHFLQVLFLQNFITKYCELVFLTPFVRNWCDLIIFLQWRRHPGPVLLDRHSHLGAKFFVNLRLANNFALKLMYNVFHYKLSIAIAFFESRAFYNFYEPFPVCIYIQTISRMRSHFLCIYIQTIFFSLFFSAFLQLTFCEFQNRKMRKWTRSTSLRPVVKQMGILMEIQVKKTKRAMLTILEGNFSKLIQLLSFQTEEQLETGPLAGGEVGIPAQPAKDCKGHPGIFRSVFRGGTCLPQTGN